MMGWKTFKAEWLARREGRRRLETDLPRSAREVVGPTGAMLSRGWDVMAANVNSYARSFDPRVPPSIFVSERDRNRHNIPIPLIERMIAEQASSDDPDES